MARPAGLGSAQLEAMPRAGTTRPSPGRGGPGHDHLARGRDSSWSCPGRVGPGCGPHVEAMPRASQVEAEWARLLPARVGQVEPDWARPLLPRVGRVEASASSRRNWARPLLPRAGQVEASARLRRERARPLVDARPPGRGSASCWPAQGGPGRNPARGSGSSWRGAVQAAGPSGPRCEPMGQVESRARGCTTRWRGNTLRPLDFEPRRGSVMCFERFQCRLREMRLPVTLEDLHAS
ncbi:hypothetical protein Salat_1453900 [Sesamum alatum]|uniref:Uncharacterized protein n=1 Tax=Sesamum alatum TaxID=300844 RepID=A0AAE1YAU5_9LAMI|nr:hypothetical protein Salat_1453900 [Sesamum alatum]